MGWELDSKNRAILYHLSLDSRQPISRLSKKVKLNREVVRYRIGRMVKDGVISKFVAFYSLPKVGYVPISFYLRFQNTSAEEEEEVIEYLRGKRNVIWLASMDGRFSLGFTLCTESAYESAEFIAELRDRYRKFISELEMANVVSIWRFSREYLLEKDNGRERRTTDGYIERAEVDLIDRKILKCIGEDARMKAVEIARRAGVSADAVANRLSSLKKRGIITNFTILIDNPLLKRRHFRSFISFHSVKNDKERFISYCNAHPNAVQLKQMLGHWEYEVDLELENEPELRAEHEKFKEHFSGSVRSTSFVSIYKVHKFDFGGFLV